MDNINKRLYGTNCYLNGNFVIYSSHSNLKLSFKVDEIYPLKESDGEDYNETESIEQLANLIDKFSSSTTYAISSLVALVIIDNKIEYITETNFDLDINKGSDDKKYIKIDSGYKGKDLFEINLTSLFSDYKNIFNTNTLNEFFYDDKSTNYGEDVKNKILLLPISLMQYPEFKLFADENLKNVDLHKAVRKLNDIVMDSDSNKYLSIFRDYFIEYYFDKDKN